MFRSLVTILLSLSSAVAFAETTSFQGRGGAGSNNSFDRYLYTITSPDPFEVASGSTSISVVIDADPITNIYPFLNRFGVSSFSFELEVPNDQQIRTSYSLFEWFYQIIDAESGLLVEERAGASRFLATEGGFRVEPDVSFAAQQLRSYELKLSFEFLAGYSLVPSMDPACASVQCMIAVQDKFYFKRAFTSPVPEPAIQSMLIGGLAVVGSFSIRRRYRRT